MAKTLDKLLSVKETTAVKLLTNLAEFPAGTKFVYRIESWYYPDYDFSEVHPASDGIGNSQLWYIGVTKQEVPRWMYSLLLEAEFYKGKNHGLKELFELEFKAAQTEQEEVER